MIVSTLQGLSIPEGVVTQIAKDGVVLWAKQSDKPIILEVEKITSNTYAGETLYENEEFILFDIYPKTNGTVNVTYGGLTKTITDTSGAEEPNAQQVFFGTFNGVSDSVATPASGTLTIEGDCYGFGYGSFENSAKMISGLIACGNCVTNIVSLGNVEIIPDYGLYGLYGTIRIKGNVVNLPPSVKSIGNHAFVSQENLTSINVSEGLESIGSSTFSGCKLTSFHIPASVADISDNPWIGMTTLETLSVSDDNVEYSMSSNCLIEERTKRLVIGFASGVIPSDVKSIGNDAFYNVGLTGKLVIPPGVISIGVGAFECCEGITELSLPETLEHIDNNAFRDCDGLTNITIPKNVTYIGKNGIGAIDNLTTVTVLAETPPTAGDNIFYSSNFLPDIIIVPKGCGAAYKAAQGWSKFADLIVEAS